MSTDIFHISFETTSFFFSDETPHVQVAQYWQTLTTFPLDYMAKHLKEQLADPTWWSDFLWILKRGSTRAKWLCQNLKKKKKNEGSELTRMSLTDTILPYQFILFYCLQKNCLTFLSYFMCIITLGPEKNPMGWIGQILAKIYR